MRPTRRSHIWIGSAGALPSHRQFSLLPSVAEKRWNCAGADGEWQVVAGLDAGCCGQTGDVLAAGEAEVGHGFMAHMFDDVERDGGEPPG